MSSMLPVMASRAAISIIASATAERFLPNPFATQNDQRMYRTGDLARWRKDGVVEFLGRVDSQVKILGHRVEPGEVEATLGAHIGLEQTCVVPIDGENESKRLAAYYVAKSGAGVTAEELRSYVATKLPQYMVPTFFIPIPALPLSPNGKVDRSALPPPQVLTTGQNATAGLTTKLEQTIVAFWQEVLRVPSVRLDDNFFDLGGDSLLAYCSACETTKGISDSNSDNRPLRVSYDTRSRSAFEWEPA